MRINSRGQSEKMAEKKFEKEEGFRKCKRIISKVEEGKETKLVWQLEDWDNSLQILKSEANCNLLLDNTSLSFSFKEHSKTTLMENGGKMTAPWLSLLLNRDTPDTSSSGESSDGPLPPAPAGFKIRVDRLDEKLDIYFNCVPTTTVALTTNSTIVLKDDFIQLSTAAISDNSGDSDGTNVAKAVVHPNCLRYGITVTELSCLSNYALEGEVEAPVAISGGTGSSSRGTSALMTHLLNWQKSQASLSTGQREMVDEDEWVSPSDLVEIDAQPYACRAANCTKRFADPSSLRNHVRAAHSGCTAPSGSSTWGPVSSQLGRGRKGKSSRY